MDLQMWMPRSLIRFTRSTSAPQASSIRATAMPIASLRRCPRCSGLLVLGQENSTTTRWPASPPLAPKRPPWASTS